MALERMTVSLTAEERDMRAREAARFLAEYRQREDHKKEVVKELTDELKDIREKAEAAAHAANTGVEEREVPVSPKPNNERLIMEFFRDDTGEFVRSRPMTDDEARTARQTVLPLRSATTISPLRGNTKPPITS